MSFGIAVKRGNAHQSMHPVFAFEVTKSKIALDFQSHGFYSGHIAFLVIQFPYFVARFFGPHHVHSHQHRSPIATFGSTGTGSDLQYRTQTVAFVRKHILEFDGFDMVLGKTVLFVQFFHRKFAFLVEFVGQLQFVGHFGCLVVIFNPFFLGTKIFYVQFRFLGIVPKIGSQGFFFLVGNFNQFGINVKDTSSTHQGVPQYLLFVR